MPTQPIDLLNFSVEENWIYTDKCKQLLLHVRDYLLNSLFPDMSGNLPNMVTPGFRLDKFYEFLNDFSFLEEFGQIPFQDLERAEKLTLVIALVPHLYPGFYDQLLAYYYPDGNYPAEFGWATGTDGVGLLPTINTALLMLAGTCFQDRREMAKKVFGTERLLSMDLLTLGELPAGEPEFNRLLIIRPYVLHYIIYSDYIYPKDPEPVEPVPIVVQCSCTCTCTCSASTPTPTPNPNELPADFPGQNLASLHDWNKLVLTPTARQQVDDVRNWVQNHSVLNNVWGMESLFKPGYRVLFYGPSGTGKTLTAQLLAGSANQLVYRVDLSLVMAKYSGETEKVLDTLFNVFKNSNVILFFDEADSLFGKRTETQNAHDRFVDPEVAYLLQRIEEYSGLVVLSTSQKGQPDSAFVRRFQAMIPFAMPAVSERKKLWSNIKSAYTSRFEDIETDPLATRYELSGASIANVVQFAALRALATGPGSNKISYNDLVEGIRLEYQKDGRLL